MASPLISAKYPLAWPITSTMKILREATADCLILSTSFTMVFSAVSAPILSSDPGRSLLIEAGKTHDRYLQRWMEIGQSAQFICRLYPAQPPAIRIPSIRWASDLFGYVGEHLGAGDRSTRTEFGSASPRPSWTRSSSPSPRCRLGPAPGTSFDAEYRVSESMPARTATLTRCSCPVRGHRRASLPVEASLAGLVS